MTNTQRTPSQWRNLIQEQQQSNHSVSEFCKKHKLSSSNFYHWRKRLSMIESKQCSDKTEQIDNWQSIQVPEPQGTHSKDNPSWDIELSLPNGVTLRMRQ